MTRRTPRTPIRMIRYTGQGPLDRHRNPTALYEEDADDVLVYGVEPEQATEPGGQRDRALTVTRWRVIAPIEFAVGHKDRAELYRGTPHAVTTQVAGRVGRWENNPHGRRLRHEGIVFYLEEVTP